MTGIAGILMEGNYRGKEAVGVLLLGQTEGTRRSHWLDMQPRSLMVMVVFVIGMANPLVGYHTRTDRILRSAGHAESRAIGWQATPGDNSVALAHTGFQALFETDIESFGSVEQRQLIADDEAALLYGP
jgi:hypothetical protein